MKVVFKAAIKHLWKLLYTSQEKHLPAATLSDLLPFKFHEQKYFRCRKGLSSLQSKCILSDRADN